MSERKFDRILRLALWARLKIIANLQLKFYYFGRKIFDQ